MEDYYEALGCSPGASLDQLKQAYQILLLQHHPDKLQQRGAITQENEKDMLSRYHLIDKAWKVLGSAALRKEYDARWQQRSTAQQCPIQDTVHFADFQPMDPDAASDFSGSQQLDSDASSDFCYPCRCSGLYILSRMDVLFNVDLVSCESCSLSIQVEYPENKDTCVGNDLLASN